MTLAGIYPLHENLDSTAMASATPRAAALPQLGCSAHRIMQNTASAMDAQQAISVVATPAWPSTGGRVEKRKTASTAVVREKRRAHHQYTVKQPRMKKGRLPRRAAVRFCQ